MRNKYAITCGTYIKNARLQKDMSINDLAFALDKENVREWEKKIKSWEANKSYPELEDIYKLAYILYINPTELLTIRNSSRKRFIKKTAEPKKSHDWVTIFDNIEISSIIIGRTILFIGLCVFAWGFYNIVNIFFGDGDKITERILVKQIKDNVNITNEIDNDFENTNSINQITNTEVINNVVNTDVNAKNTNKISNNLNNVLNKIQ